MQQFKKLLAGGLLVILINYSYAGDLQAINNSYVITYEDMLTKQQIRHIKCLADNIYREAGNQSYTGKIAVAYVTVNRVENKSFANNICDVVYSKQGGICQFSWTCMKLPPINRFSYNYKESEQIAHSIYFDKKEIKDPTKGALFFHSKNISPNWKRKKTVQIQDHIFYR